MTQPIRNLDACWRRYESDTKSLPQLFPPIKSLDQRATRLADETVRKSLSMDLKLRDRSFKQWSSHDSFFKNRPNIIKFNQNIVAVLKDTTLSFDQRVKKAREIISTIESEGLTPDVFSFHPLIDAYVKQDNEIEAYKVLEELSARNIQPNVVIYNSLISMFVRKENTSRALEVFRSMKAQGILPSIVTINLIIDLLVSEKHFTEAEELFSKYCSVHFKHQTKEMDLHQLSHGAAYSAFRIFLRSYHSDFSLITGRGLHGQNEPFAMRKYMMAKLEEYHPELKFTVDSDNPGKILISF